MTTQPPPESKLSTLGRAALYEYMMEALAPDTSGSLDAAAIINNPDITDEDLQLMVQRVAELNLLPASSFGEGNRSELVGQLEDLLDRAATRPDALAQDTKPTIRGGATEGANPSLPRYRHKSQDWKDSGKLGNVSQRVLRQARKAAGWQPVSHMPRTPPKQRDEIIDVLTQRFLDARIAEGMSPEEAKAAMEKSYIAITQHYRVKRRSRDVNEQWEIEYDYDRPTYRWVDLSPQAIEDFKKAREAQKIEPHALEEFRTTSNIASSGPSLFNEELAGIYKRIGISYRPDQGAALIRQVIEKETQFQMGVRNMGREEARKWVDGNYIHAETVQHEGHDAVRYILTPKAHVDLERAVIDQMLEAEKVRR